MVYGNKLKFIAKALHPWTPTLLSLHFFIKFKIIQIIVVSTLRIIPNFKYKVNL